MDLDATPLAGEVEHGRAAETPARLPWPLALLMIGGLSAGLWLALARLAAALWPN